MHVVILLFISFIAFTANAQQVYKCVRGKEVSYQSAACDGTQKIAKRWDATPEPTTDELRQHQLENLQLGAGSPQFKHAGVNRTRAARSNRNPRNGQSKMSRCDAAKKRRDFKLKSVGLKRTFDLLRKLDDAVYEACK